jgi:hypothetical protein
MHESLGWSRPLLNGALSLGLLSTGVVAFPVGTWIDRHGGRSVMTLGSLVGGAALAGLGLGGDTVGVLSALDAHWCQYGRGVV